MSFNEDSFLNYSSNKYSRTFEGMYTVSTRVFNGWTLKKLVKSYIITVYYDNSCVSGLTNIKY